MQFTLFQRRLTGWIAVLAVLLAALAPSLSQAMAAGGSASWVELCSAQGSKWVQVDDDGSVPAPGSSLSHHLEHCPFCASRAPSLGLPPADSALLVPAQLRHVMPPAFLAAPATAFAWLSAQPRAPPLFS